MENDFPPPIDGVPPPLLISNLRAHPFYQRVKKGSGYNRNKEVGTGNMDTKQCRGYVIILITDCIIGFHSKTVDHSVT